MQRLLDIVGILAKCTASAHRKVLKLANQIRSLKKVLFKIFLCHLSYFPKATEAHRRHTLHLSPFDYNTYRKQTHHELILRDKMQDTIPDCYQHWTEEVQRSQYKRITEGFVFFWQALQSLL